MADGSGPRNCKDRLPFLSWGRVWTELGGGRKAASSPLNAVGLGAFRIRVDELTIRVSLGSEVWARRKCGCHQCGVSPSDRIGQLRKGL